MSKRVELPEVKTCGVFLMLETVDCKIVPSMNYSPKAEIIYSHPTAEQTEEIAHRCNHYMELVEALEELLEIQQATKQGFEQRQKARAALAKAKGE